MRRGLMDLLAVMDWHSRYVLSWRVSNTLETAFCLEALDYRTPWEVYREGLAA